MLKNINYKKVWSVTKKVLVWSMVALLSMFTFCFILTFLIFVLPFIMLRAIFRPRRKAPKNSRLVNIALIVGAFYVFRDVMKAIRNSDSEFINKAMETFKQGMDKYILK